MNTIAEFDAEPDFKLVRNLLRLLLISLCLHGLSLSLLRWTPANVTASQSLPIKLSINISAKEEYLIQDEEQLNEPTQALTQPEPLAPKNQAAAPVHSMAKAPKKSEIIYTAPQKSRSTYTCNPKQKRTAGHVCAQEAELTNYDFSGVYETHTRTLFPAEQSVAAERASDLRAVDALIAQRASIDKTIDSFEAPPEHLLRAKAQIEGEIARIDKKYTSIDLLKVFGSAYKTTKRIVSDRKEN